MELINEILQDLNNKITAESILLFDMDGTLIDTNLANFLSYEKAIYFVTKSVRSLKYNPDNRFNRSNIKNIVPNLSENEYESIIQKKEEYYKTFLSETKLNNLVADFLFKYSETNRTVLVTNCREDRALTTLNHHGLTDKFTNIFYRQFSHDNRINKFQNAISKLNVSPTLVVAFENEEIEIDDARRAGIEIIINPLNL